MRKGEWRGRAGSNMKSFDFDSVKKVRETQNFGFDQSHNGRLVRAGSIVPGSKCLSKREDWVKLRLGSVNRLIS